MASSSLPSDLQSMKDEEDKLREQFVSSGSSSSSFSSYSSFSSNGGVDDPHALLIDVFAKRSTFARQNLSAEEKAIPRLFENPEPGSVPVGSPIVSDESSYKLKWDGFTSKSLEGLDWSNTFAAGGAVVRCLDLWGGDESSQGPNESKGSDVDLFLYGLSDEQANNKIQSIYNTVQSNAKKLKVQSVEIVRTKNAVTIIGQYPIRHVQIILRMYKSPAEVLMGFDIDSCTAGYDGSRVWALPRCRRALTKRYNLVDLSRRSLTYEIRLFKYSKRGFNVLVPGYRPQDVDSGLYDDSRPLKEVTGLARLLLLNHRRNTATPAPVRPQPRKLDLKPDGFIDERLMESKVGKENSGLQVPTTADDEDYILVFVPYGPRWYLHRTINLLTLRDKSQYFARRQSNPNDHSHVLVLGMDSIFTGRASWCKSCRNSFPSTPPAGGKSDDFVRGPISWLRDNPGKQADSNLLTGSFHPLSPEDWEKDALKFYGGQKGFVPAPPVAPVRVSFAKKAPAKKVPTAKKAPAKKAVAKKAMPSKFGGFGAPASGGFAPASGGFAPATGGFGKAPATGGFGKVPATGGFGKAPATGGFGSAPATGGFGSAPASGGFGSAPASGGFGSAPASGGFGKAGFGVPHSFPSSFPTPVPAYTTPTPSLSPFPPSLATPGVPPASSGGKSYPQLEQQYKAAAPKETDTKLFLLMSLLKKGGLLTPNDHSALKDKVINGDANLICALEVFEIDYDFEELADTFHLIAQL